MAYPDHIKAYDNDCLIWHDGTRMPIHRPGSLSRVDAIQQDFQKALDHPDLYGQIALPYRCGRSFSTQTKTDPGRIRDDAFFKKMYGSCEQDVHSHLTPVLWMPNVYKNPPYTLLVSRINGVDKKIQRISKKLEQLVQKKPEYIDFLDQPGGTFMWRPIAGTQRMSAHCYGITIDINVAHSHYWLWDYKKQHHLPESKVILEKDIPDDQLPQYRNTIPLDIIEIFEAEGFIWGGKWTQHYDTMHFEYRPELFPHFFPLSSKRGQS